MPQLIAVSKTKPVGAVLEAYQCGQRHFGENYVSKGHSFILLCHFSVIWTTLSMLYYAMIKFIPDLS